jgi:hypothetical protein
VNVARQFKADFDRIVEHYGCSPVEVEEMKACVELDPEAAVKCFAALAAELDQDQPEPERYADADQYLRMGKAA